MVYDELMVDNEGFWCFFLHVKHDIEAVKALGGFLDLNKRLSALLLHSLSLSKGLPG